VSATYDTVIYTIGDDDVRGPIINDLTRWPGIAFLRVEPSQVIETVKSARAVIVPSGAAQRRLGSLMQKLVPPNKVLPLPFPALSEENEAPSFQTPVIVVPGVLRTGSQSERLIEALSLLRPGVRARLLFLGQLEARLARDLADSARRLGVADDVAVTGLVSSHAYRAHLATAQCAVQLQSGWTAGGSLSLLECLAAGVPVLTDRTDAVELQTTGVVCIQPGGSAHELAAALRDLLLDPEQARSRRAAAREHAASWTSAKFVEGLLEVVDHFEPNPREPAL
jgi:glycosyltransferase involved in cell wall biosynthesis